VRIVTQGEICLFYKYTDTPVDMVLGETNLTGKHADRNETKFTWLQVMTAPIAAFVEQNSPARSEETFRVWCF